MLDTSLYSAYQEKSNVIFLLLILFSAALRLTRASFALRLICARAKPQASRELYCLLIVLRPESRVK